MKKRFSDEQIVAILREVDTKARTINEACRHYKVSVPTIYSWRKKFGSLQESEVKRLREMEKENSRLKRLLAERDLEVDALKELVKKK